MSDEPKRFYSVGEAARMLGVSTEHLYRAIKAEQFPAVRIMGRIIVPAKAIDALIEASVERRTVIDAEWFVVKERRPGRRAWRDVK